MSNEMLIALLSLLGTILGSAGDITTTIFTGCIGYLVTYAAKSTTEKISRNRYGLNPDGNPIKTQQPESRDVGTSG